MKANELRIGNYVRIKEDDGSNVITRFYDDRKIWVNISEDASSTFRFSELEPIPLTEEWLVKFGFTLMKETEYTINTFELNGVRIWNKKGDFTQLIYDTDKIELKYVQELQNLYFALTGKEL